jgi:polyisoprenoid-binding protein YceI
VAKYPTLSFKASRIVFNGDAPCSVPGEFTMLGVTSPATLTVERFNCGMHPMLKKEVCGAEATVTIKRSEFGMTKYVPALGDDVKLEINVEALKD